jgi:hypothetical protein
MKRADVLKLSHSELAQLEAETKPATAPAFLTPLAEGGGGGGNSGGDIVVPADVDAYLRHEYYDVFVRDGHAHDVGFTDIWSTGTESTVSATDDGQELVELSFLFPFYGHLHKELGINANGFVTTLLNRECRGFCNWALTNPEESLYVRYVAPLMSDFDPSANVAAIVHHRQGRGIHRANVTSLIVQWSNVTLWNQTDAAADRFTFQCILSDDGEIVFNYLRLPFSPLERVPTADPRPYPTTIGVEDAVLIRINGGDVAFAYRPVSLNFSFVSQHAEGRSIQLVARPTCLSNTNCSSCVAFYAANTHRARTLQCGWCASASSCTDGLGREISSSSLDCFNVPDALARTEAVCAVLRQSNSGADNTTLVILAIAITVVFLVCLIVVCCAFIIRQNSRRASRAAAAHQQFDDNGENDDGGAAVRLADHGHVVVVMDDDGDAGGDGNAQLQSSPVQAFRLDQTSEPHASLFVVNEDEEQHEDVAEDDGSSIVAGGDDVELVSVQLSDATSNNTPGTVMHHSYGDGIAEEIAIDGDNNDDDDVEVY